MNYLNKTEIEQFLESHKNDTNLVPVHLANNQIQAIKELSELLQVDFPDMVMMLVEGILTHLDEAKKQVQRGRN